MDFLWLKTVHVVAVIAWFAGLFYLPRLFVYHAEALAGPEPARAVLHAQFARMEAILNRAIMVPALVVALGAATGLLLVRPVLLAQGWLLAKLALVACVVGYHVACVWCMRRLATARAPMSGQAFRLFNEAPTVLLLLIVFLVVFQQAATPATAARLAAGFSVLLVLGVAMAARRRLRRSSRPAGPAAARPGRAGRGGPVALAR